MSIFTTTSAKHSRDLARTFTETLSGGDIILFEGNLGSGKTTFIQGILETLGAEKPYTSPTFIIMKTYDLINARRKMQDARKSTPTAPNLSLIHHIDTYRIASKDLLDLGWKEMLADPHALILLEWPERVRDILPERAKTIRFTHKGADVREITLP